MIKHSSRQTRFGKAASSRGFTLVELMVAISLFLVVLTISLGSITSIFEANRKSQSLKAIMTNLNFAMEIMSRDIRFGTRYHCGESGVLSEPQNCTSGDSAIAFRSLDGEDVVYRLQGSGVERSINGGAFLPLTAPEIHVQDLKFFVLGAGQNDEAAFLQPKALILIRGYAGERPSSRSTFVLQTTVSQRVLDTEI